MKIYCQNGKHLHGHWSSMYYIQLIVDRNPEMIYLFTLPFTVYWRADWPCKAIFERLHLVNLTSYVHIHLHRCRRAHQNIFARSLLSTKNTSLARLYDGKMALIHSNKTRRVFKYTMCIQMMSTFFV